MKMLAIWLLFFSLDSTADLQCHQIFQRLTVEWADELHGANSRSFYYLDPIYDFHFVAALSEKGDLSFSLELINLELSIRSRYRGHELFDNMISYFGITKINSIKGEWSQGVNYTQFYKARAEGLSATEAAKTTWTAYQAARYGFTEVKIDRYRPKKNNLSNEPPDILLHFKRPQ